MVIGTYAAFVVRMVRREVALPHYKVTFTGGKWRTGAEMSVRYEFAGASAPEYVVSEIVEVLCAHGAVNVDEFGCDLKEKSFPLPKEVSI